MNIAQYVASLLPTTERNTVISDIGVTREVIKDKVQPAYAQAADLFARWKFKSDEMKGFISVFERNIKGRNNANIVAVISESFPTVLENLDEVEALVRKVYSQEVAGGGMTYLKTNILQFVDCASFVSRYSLKLLNYIYICETAQIDDGGVTITESLSKAEIEWLNQHLLSFCIALRAVSGQPNATAKTLTDIPDVLVTSDNYASLQETLGARKLDPFGMGFIPVSLNPIYHIRMHIAKWQANRYKAAKEEVTLLELRKLNLQQVQDGKPDARTQADIKYLESRVEKLNYEIAQMEADYA